MADRYAIAQPPKIYVLGMGMRDLDLALMRIMSLMVDQVRTGLHIMTHHHPRRMPDRIPRYCSMLSGHWIALRERLMEISEFAEAKV